jgi:hypothetical protein
MTRDRLAEAIRLREEGRAKQDQVILQEARTLLLELAAAYPDDAEILFQTGVVCFASRKCSALQPKLPKHLPAV